MAHTPTYIDPPMNHAYGASHGAFHDINFTHEDDTTTEETRWTIFVRGLNTGYLVFDANGNFYPVFDPVWEWLDGPREHQDGFDGIARAIAENIGISIA